MYFLSIIMFSILSQGEVCWPYADVTVRLFPNNIMYGDTVYIVIEAKNPYDKPIFISDSYTPVDGDVKVHITDSMGNKERHLFETVRTVVVMRYLSLTQLSPFERRTIATLSICVPP
ncbi:MAG: hypothetical protein ACRC2T_07185, partial [Thermoguttaceae bacterium]